MLYFRREWKETRGDGHDDWGRSVWWFECDAAGSVRRQIECYSGGQVLKYDVSHDADEYGGLSERGLDLTEFQVYSVSAAQFESMWSLSNALNR